MSDYEESYEWQCRVQGAKNLLHRHFLGESSNEGNLYISASGMLRLFSKQMQLCESSNNFPSAYIYEEKFSPVSDVALQCKITTVYLTDEKEGEGRLSYPIKNIIEPHGERDSRWEITISLFVNDKDVLNEYRNLKDDQSNTQDAYRKKIIEKYRNFYAFQPDSYLKVTFPDCEEEEEEVTHNFYHILLEMFSGKYKIRDECDPRPLPFLQKKVVATNLEKFTKDGDGINPAFQGESIVKNIYISLLSPLLECESTKSYKNLTYVRGCLFFGPPGTGKSYFSRYLAKNMGFKVLYYGCPADLVDKYIGNTEKKINNIFLKATISLTPQFYT